MLTRADRRRFPVLLAVIAALALAMAMPFSMVHAQSVSEGAVDLPATTATTGEVEVGGSVMGNIGDDFDTDWFGVELKAGRTYRVDMKGAIYVAPGILQDSELTLRLPQINAIYDGDGDVLFNTFSRDESSAHHLFRVTFHVHADGTYYIAASGESFEKGGYKLRVIDITRDDGAAPVAVTVQFGAASYTATEGGRAATVTVNLSADPERSVTIPIIAEGAGGTGSGDYTLSETSVTIDSGDTSATFVVTATDDNVYDGAEALTLSFGDLPSEVTAADTQGTAEVSLVDNEILSTSSLVPTGINAGDGFRLLFVTSGGRDATSTDIDDYNAFVQEAAAGGHADIQSYSGLFRALASTDAVDAIDNTATTHTTAEPGVPIWWLNGPKAADNYSDFYDDDWDHYDPGRNESGAEVDFGANDRVWTGTEEDGEATIHILGSISTVTVATPGVGTDLHFVGAAASSSEVWPLYGLSFVLYAAEAGDTTAPSPASAKVSSDGTIVHIVFDEDLDASGSAPETTAFDVTVGGGTAVNPTSVAFHATEVDTITLTMAATDTVAAGGTVTVAYDKPTSNALANAASNEVESFTGTDAIPALNRPAAPVVSLTAGNGKLTAAWTAPANGGSAITGYDVEWKTASQTWAQAATAGQSDTAAADATGHEITGLTNNTEYTVRVRAVNGAGNGPWSAETSETPNPAAPGKPQNVQLVFEETTSGYDAKLSWDAPDDLGGGTLQSYSWLLSKSVDGGNLIIESDDMQETAPAADSPIRERLPSPEIGDVYKLTVTVWNEAASASAALSAIFVLGEMGAPEVTQAAMRSDGLLLAWSAPEIASSLNVTGYEARYKLTGAADVDDSWTTVAVGAASPYTITGLADSAGYNVRMRAVIEWNSGAYYGDWSEAKRADNPWVDAGGVEVSSDPASDETYGRNETIEFTVEFNEAVTVTGEPEFEFCLGAVDDSCTEGADPPTLRRAAHSSGDGTDKLVFSYVVGLRFTDLDTDGIRIGDSAIRLGAGEKIVSADTETAAHLGHAAPGIQTGHKVDDSNVADTTAPSVSSAKVSEDGMTILIVFDQALDSSSTVAVGEFAVMVGAALPRKPSGAALSGADTVTLTMTPAIAAGETVSVAYTAPATGGLQDASNNKVAGFTESVINRPAKPTGLTLTAGHETLTASWTAPTATGGSAITRYDVEWKTAAQTWEEATTAGQSDTAAADATTHEITGLTNDTEYTVRVRAVNGAGNGPWSVEESETPAVPANKNADLADLSVEGVTVAGFDKDTLSYEVVVVLPRASLVTIETTTVNDQARVRYSPVGTDASVASPGYQVSVLHKTPTTYTITVTSADGSVTKVYAIEITRYTLPGAPGGLNAQASYRQVELSWNDPDNSDIDSYQYRVSDDGGNTWDPDWTEIEGSGALTTGLTLTGLDHRTEYRFEVRAVVQGAAGVAASVTATADDDFPNDTTTTGEVDVGGSVTGTIEFGDDVDWVKVDLEADTRYQIDTEGADTGRGTLVDPAIEFLADSMGDGIADTEDSDNGVGKNARAIYTPTAAGAYYVSVSSETSAPGTYTVSVIVLGANGNSEADTDFPDTTTTTGRVEVGASATGNIHTDGNRDAFRVDLERGKTYQIDLEGAGTNRGSLVDPQLFAVADSTGSSLSGTQNNDISESNLNSRVTLTPTATGSYYVLVRGSGTGTGTYTLSVRDVTPPDAPGGLNAQASYRQVELSWNDPDNSDIDSYQYRVSDDGGNTWDPDWTEIEGSGASTTSLTLSGLDHRTAYRFEVRVMVQGDAGAAASDTATPAGTGVPHDWDLRPPGIATGKTFRLLVVTSDRRNGQSGDVDDYNEHVQDAVDDGHSAIQDYSSDFRALVGTRDGASPRDNTHSNKDSDGPGEQIWWLNGPKAADNYADFYDGDWDHTNPVRFESGNPYTFLGYDNDDPHLRSVWTGARADGSRASTNHLGNDGNAYVGAPYYRDSPLRYENWAWSLNARIRLYGLSPVFLVEAPDAPYATTAAITSTPNNGTDYRTGEVVTVTVTFSEDVTVMGTPQLPLQIGGEERDADYVASDSSSTVLSFSYVVTDDDTDLDGISINAFALKLNGGSIKRTDTNVDAALTHTRVLADDDQLVNLPPLITGIEVTSSPKADPDNDTYGLVEDIEITVTFSEAVNVTGDVDFGLSVSGAKRARLKSGNGTTELVFAYTVQSGDEDDDGIWIGNHNTDHPTFDLQGDQSVIGVDSGRAALLEHSVEGTQGDHKVDGSNTGADATLSALSLSGITLDQTFTAGTAVTSFTATMDAAPTTVTATLTATPTQSGASVDIDPDDDDANTTDHEVDLDVGDTVITVTVTSSNGASTRTYTITVTRPAGIGVAHDWDLRPPGIATGKTFRLLIVTSDRRNGESGDVDDYNDHVQDAVDGGHSAIRAHSSGFRALVGTKDGASPRDNTHSNPGSDGDGEEIWWLNGPRAADDYDDFYDGSWDHTNPVRLESGNSYTFLEYDNDEPHLRSVWTGARADGTRAGSKHLGNNSSVGAFVGAPYYRDSPLRYQNWEWSLNARIRLYGLSPVFLVEAPDAPYATTAAITTEPTNGTDYRTGEVVKATVTFSEDVTVMGTPQLPLQIGGEEREADYVAGDSSPTVLSFSYTVTDDDTDRDGISIDAFALKLNGGSIKRTDTNVDAALTHTRVLTDDDQLVNLHPLITDIEVTSTPQATSANDTYGLGENIEITVTFDEAVNVTGGVDFGISVGGAKRAPLKSGSGTTELVFAYTVQSGDEDDDGIFIGNQDSTNATLALQDGQTIVGTVSGLDALLEHERPGSNGQHPDHKVDGSLTGADATLSSLTLSDITLVPAFAPGATAYTATTRLSSTTVTIAISQGQNGATGRITAPTDADLNASGHQVTLAEDADTVITVTVTSSNGDSMRTYTVTVTRQPATEADATLSVLALSGGITLVPAFDPRTTAYAATTSLSSTTVTATASQSGANMDIDPDDADTNTTDHDVNLAEGDTVITVTVISTNGDSTRTYTVTVTREAANGNRSAPPPPKNVRAVEEKGGVRLTWQPPDGSAVTGYRIERRPAGGQGSGPQRSHGQPRDHHTLVEDTGSADTGYTDESAEQGVEYEYRVSARNEAGTGEASEWVRAGTGEASEWVRAGPESASNSPATGAPTISGTTQVGETLTADISGISDADGLSGETFTYQWVSGDGTTGTDMENATGSTYKLVAADQGKSVKVRVTFTDGGGNEETLTSAPTGPVWGDGRPGAPRNLAATAGNKEITLSWDPPADNGNAPATRYRIEWRVDGKDYSGSQWGTARSTTYTTNDQANLANGVRYFFRVKAGNGSGNSQGSYGPSSGEVSATPTSGSAVDLGTPVLSNTENLHHGMVQLDWEDVEDAGWYVVQYYHVKGGEWLDLPAVGVDIALHGSSAVVSNLHGLSWLRVRAMSCAGASEWSQIEQSFGTNESDWEGVPVPEVEEGDEIEPCPVVLGTPVLSDTETLHHGMVQLDWQDIEDAGWYVVQYYHVKGGEWLDLPAEGVDIAFHGSGAVVSNLHGLSWLRVRAMSCAGASEWSQIEQLFGTNASDWEGVPVPEVAEGDQIEPCSEDADTSDNSPATGAPTISGTVQVGETLTADTSGIADADGLGNVQYECQWLSDDSDISGATNATYTLVAGDEGKAIKVEVSFTDDAGNEETLTTAATDAVAAEPTPNSPASGAPAITGLAQVGETLTADTSRVLDADGLTNPAFTYRWLAGDAEIAGATSLTYTLADTDEGKAIRVEVSFTDDADNEETLTSAATDEVDVRPNSPATGAPTINGTAQVGETLTANTSGVADADGLGSVRYQYQWLADGTHIAGATGSTYTVAAADEGKGIRVEVTFTDDAGYQETLSSAATDAVAAAPTPNSPATGAPTITGTAQVGETLSALTSGIADEDGLGNADYSYRWLAGDAEIAGATVSTYTLTDSEESKAITVQVSFTDDQGNEETLSSEATGAVDARPNSPATGAPTITGTTQVGETLTANTSGIADADGLANATFSYQWLAADADIAGATASTYTLADADEGKTISVQVGFTDDADNKETLTSAATDAVASEPSEPPDKPKGLEATATHDSVTLTWDDPGDDSITGYVILRRIPAVDPQGHFDELAANTGTAATTYTDDTVASETRYTYRIKAINGAGTSERSRWVHIDTPAAPVPDKPTGLEATESHGQVVLTWDDPGDDSITGYVILRRVRVNDTGGDFDVLVADTASAATTYTDDTVAGGLTYTYRIKAINQYGASERSRWVHIDTPAAP